MLVLNKATQLNAEGGRAWPEGRSVSITWAMVGSNAVIRIPECHVSKIAKNHMTGLESSKIKFPHLLNNNSDVKIKGIVKT